MWYEVLNTNDRREDRGVMYQYASDAIEAAAKADGDVEVWQVASDPHETRVLLVYPEREDKS